jgi:hypothetical protein
MTIHFGYNKKEVLQALRYHFISRAEIRVMFVIINLFALVTAILFYFKKITAGAFFLGSFLWFTLMASFWFFLPGMVYRRAETFKDHFTMHFDEDSFTIGNDRGSRTYSWKQVKRFMETPLFFYLYFDSKSFFLVPKNACRDSDEVYNLRQLLKQKVGY